MTSPLLVDEARGQPPRQARSVLSPPFVDKLIAWATDQNLNTPAFCLAPEVLHAGMRRLRQQLAARISYATKANSHPLVLRELVGLVDEFNVTNLVHLDELLALGVDPRRLAWLHPVLIPKILEAVLARGVRRFVIDDQRGLDLLCVAGADVAVTLRLLPPDTGESARSVVRFGNSADVLLDLGRRAKAAGLEVGAVSFFVGTKGEGMGEAAPFRAGIEAVAALHAELGKEGIIVPTINIGGGFPGSQRRFYLDHPDFFGRISRTLHDAFGADMDVLCEPGRYLVEPCMLMVARVLADRVLAGRRFVYLDASAYGGLFETSFIDPSSGPTIWMRADSSPPQPGELLGPIMDSFDVILKGAHLPVMREGEPVVLANVGAYSMGYVSKCEGIGAPDVVVLPDELASALAAEGYE